MQEQGLGKTIVAVECYTGVDETTILRELRLRLKPVLTIQALRRHASGRTD